MARPRVPLRQRFESKFRVTPGCWPWFAGFGSKGYGTIGIGGRGGKNENAHRVSHMLYIGEIPEGLHVLHRCDNRKCVNPDHLFLGTNLDNIKDKVAKGRMPSGADHWRRRGAAKSEGHV